MADKIETFEEAVERMEQSATSNLADLIEKVREQMDEAEYLTREMAAIYRPLGEAFCRAAATLRSNPTAEQIVDIAAKLETSGRMMIETADSLADALPE